jgi:hypothetical protein
MNNRAMLDVITSQLASRALRALALALDQLRKQWNSDLSIPQHQVFRALVEYLPPHDLISRDSLSEQHNTREQNKAT